MVLATARFPSEVPMREAWEQACLEWLALTLVEESRRAHLLVCEPFGLPQKPLEALEQLPREQGSVQGQFEQVPVQVVPEQVVAILGLVEACPKPYFLQVA